MLGCTVCAEDETVACNLEEYFKVVMQPKQKPYTIFVDDTPRNFSASQKVLGLLAPSSEKTPNEIPHLTKGAKKKWIAEKINESYDSQSGISVKGLYCMALFIRVKKNEVKEVVLDWDKTLTQHSSFKCEKIDAYAAECYFGGPKRMKALKYFFQSMRELRIPVRILSSNGRVKRNPEAFTKALRYIGASKVPISFTDSSKVKEITK